MTFVAALLLAMTVPAHAVDDTYLETFDSMQDGATVHDVDSWQVWSGAHENAMAESGNTSSGSGKSLRLVGAQESVNVSRPDNYGDLSPTWIEYVVRPGLGNDQREVPATGIAAVNFNHNGIIQVSDGDNWVSTGRTFTTDTWYRVIMKLDFSTHMYSVYTSPASTPKTPFVPDKENLHFIDNEINAMSDVGFMGVHNTHSQQDSWVDEVVVHYIDKLQFVTSPMTIVKGYASGQMIVQLQNANSEPQAAWTDMIIELRSSTQTGEFSLDKDNWIPISSVLLPQGAQQVSFYFKDFREGRPTLTVNEYPDRGWTDTAQEEKIVSEGEYFNITTTTPQVAGKPFTVQVVAMDSEGNTDTGYGGTVDVLATYVSPSTGTKILTPDSAGDFVMGAKELILTYQDAGIIKIAVRDHNEMNKIGYSGDILVLPDSFGVDAETPQIVSKNFPLTVTALSADKQVLPNYQFSVKIEPVEVSQNAPAGGALNPAEIPNGSFENGVAVLNTAYNRWGVILIQASDSVYAERKGLSKPVNFVPKSISIKVKRPSASRAFFYVNENMEITVSLLDEGGLPVENFQGNISLTPTPQFSLPATYNFVLTDKGQKTFVVPAGNPGNYKIKIEDLQDNLNVESENVEVKDATIVVSNSSAPVGTTVVEIQLVDSKGKRITSENEMRITILFSEDNDNGSVFFSDAGKLILFKNGVAKVVIGNTEAESVNISAKSAFGLKVHGGKVVFGHAGASGVGALMLRETKD